MAFFFVLERPARYELSRQAGKSGVASSDAWAG